VIEPHGGRLVDRTVSADEYARWIEGAENADVTLPLDECQLQDVINLSNGRYSPLKGFMNRDDFLKVVHDRTLEDGTVWPLPIVLTVDTETASNLSPGERVPLENPEDDLVGFLDVEEIYRCNTEETARALFGTTDRDHPGVDSYHELDPFLVGGPVSVFEGLRYNDYDLQPVESRVLFRQQDWDTVVGFQTRNAPHRGHEFIQKCALQQLDGLLIQPKLGNKKIGDYRDDVILRSYEQLIEHYYLEDQVYLSVFPSRMRYAGPREAVFDALIRKNQGCTHFIIGRDHAGVGDYYDPMAAHEIFDEVGDVGIEPMFFEHAFYCDDCDEMTSRRTCPHGDDERVYPSGTKIRSLIENHEMPSEKIMRPEIASFIIERGRPFIEH